MKESYPLICAVYYTRPVFSGNIQCLLPPLTVGVVSLVVPLLTVSSGPWVTGSLGWQRPLPCLAASPSSSPQVCEPLPHSASQPLLPRLPHQGLGAKMDGEAEHSPPDGLIYSASFLSRQSWGPWGPRLESTGDSCCLRPDGPGLPVHRDAKYQTATPEWSPSVIQAAGICLKEWKHREGEQWDSLPPPSPPLTDIDLYCNNLLYYLCYGCCQGGWWETPPCFSLTVCAITINIETWPAVESNFFSAVLTEYGHFPLYLNRPLSLCSTRRSNLIR